jgi:hypothetical protein
MPDFESPTFKALKNNEQEGHRQLRE